MMVLSLLPWGRCSYYSLLKKMDFHAMDGISLIDGRTSSLGLPFLTQSSVLCPAVLSHHLVFFLCILYVVAIIYSPIDRHAEILSAPFPPPLFVSAVIYPTYIIFYLYHGSTR